jgi:hypothetical protein
MVLSGHSKGTFAGREPLIWMRCFGFSIRTSFAPLTVARAYLGWCGSPVLNNVVFLVSNDRYDSVLDEWTEMTPPMPGEMTGAIAWQGRIYAFGPDQTVAGISR